MIVDPPRPFLRQFRCTTYGEEPRRENVWLVPRPIRRIGQRVRESPRDAIFKEAIQFRDERGAVRKERDKSLGITGYEPYILIRIAFNVMLLKWIWRCCCERRWAFQRSARGPWAKELSCSAPEIP